MNHGASNRLDKNFGMLKLTVIPAPQNISAINFYTSVVENGRFYICFFYFYSSLSNLLFFLKYLETNLKSWEHMLLYYIIFGFLSNITMRQPMGWQAQRRFYAYVTENQVGSEKNVHPCIER